METNVFDRLEISVAWRDATTYGSMLSGRLQATLRERLYPRTFAALCAEMRRAPRKRTVQSSVALAEIVRAERQSAAYAQIVADPDFWSHDSDCVKPAVVSLRALDASSVLDVPVDAQRCRDLRSALCGEPHGDSDLSSALMRLVRPLAARGPRVVASTPIHQPLLVGHACVSWTDGTLRLWSDPFLRPKRDGYPDRFEPLSPFDFPERQHAVLLTHAHPDHFDPGSLFWFPNDTQFVVPAVAVETPLTLRLDVHLRQLGFTNVTVIDWYDTLVIGGFEVSALPFFGEQPVGVGASSTLRPDDRNAGNTYVVRTNDGCSSLLLADSGADPGGSILSEARTIRARFGPIDTLFCNHRRWRVYPPQYVISSVPQFLCYVPDHELSVAQRIMLEPDEAWAIADTLGAKRIIPYAMGGAPWFAELGLGVDPWRPRRRTAFDAAPADLTPPKDPDSLLASSAEVVNLLPSQGLGASGAAVWLAGRGRVDSADFTAHPPRERPRALSFSGRVPPDLISNLIELTRTDARAWVVAGPDFCDVAASAADGFLLTLALRLDKGTAITLLGPAPLCMGLFVKQPVWRRLFERVHRRAFVGLRDASDPMNAVQRVCWAPPFAGLAPALIERIAHELLDLRLTCMDQSSTRARAAAQRARAGLARAPTPSLPPPSAELVARHGATDVACALLLVKLVHNMWLTSSQGNRALAADESAFFHALIGNTEPSASRRSVERSARV